jgi:hypothetical protein
MGASPVFVMRCATISQKKVMEVRVAYGESIAIRFADGATINIPLQDAGGLDGEAVSFDAGGNVWWSL